MDTWHPHGNQWELKKDARVLLLLWIPFLEGAFALSEIVQPEISPSDTVYDFQICTTMLDNVHASLETGFSVLQCYSTRSSVSSSKPHLACYGSLESILPVAFVVTVLLIPTYSAAPKVSKVSIPSTSTTSSSYHGLPSGELFFPFSFLISHLVFFNSSTSSTLLFSTTLVHQPFPIRLLIQHSSLGTAPSFLDIPQCPPETPPPLPPHRRFNLDRITPKAANVASIPTEFTELVPHHSFPSSGFCLHDNIDASSRLDSLYVKTLNARPTPSRLQPPAYYPLFFLPVLFRFGWFTVQPRRPSSDLILTDLGSYLKRNTDSLI
ncbi:hypothetical protein PDE_05283 [Penicillium oxalicum 114-2]|uniref:Uncharacterized protein n=1 Tax=Penicillium oxalicum (strain 114-2 / CGMCC 5302) TaxID=933388 RepID=S8B6Q3_PENO1|nr:hypothetical protein PDE_05283 [Penicillium oxalicum 114-2]